MNPAYIHPLAVVEEGCELGPGTKVWHFAHVRRGARLGEECVIGKNVFIDTGVHIGHRVKIQNNVSVYHGVEIEDGVFVGPHVCFTNDKNPRAITPDGRLRNEKEWVLAKTRVGYGVAIGANSTLVAGITIGKWAMIGSGSVVTKTVPPYALVLGNPGRLAGVVAPSGEILSRSYAPGTYRTSDGTFEVIIPG